MALELTLVHKVHSMDTKQKIQAQVRHYASLINLAIRKVIHFPFLCSATKMFLAFLVKKTLWDNDIHTSIYGTVLKYIVEKDYIGLCKATANTYLRVSLKKNKWEFSCKKN